jgi:hypothetical protein
MKKVLLALLIAASAIASAKAQATHQDSVRIKQAKKDARFFKLNKNELKRFNSEHFPATSDYFNPTAGKSAPALLNDSVYVQSYRNAAFYNAVHQSAMPTFRDMLVPPHEAYGRRRPAYTSGSQTIAQNDAKKFSLSQANLEVFKVRHYPNTSDYFKPTVQTASDPALLNDSVYVRTFRDEAFYKSMNQRVHPIGHAFLIGGSIFLGVMGILVAIASALSNWH